MNHHNSNEKDNHDSISPAYQAESDAPAEGARDPETYQDSPGNEGETAQQEAELTAGDDPAEGARNNGNELEEVRDVPQGATEEMTVRNDEADAMPDEKVNAMELPDEALPSEIAPTAGDDEGGEGDVPTQDNTGGRWNVDTIAPAPPETEDLQEAFNPSSNPDEPHGEVY
jgi:hypothetical protein